MQRSLRIGRALWLAPLVALALPAVAQANHVTPTASSVTCTALTVRLDEFQPSSKPVDYTVRVDDQPVVTGVLTAAQFPGAEYTLTVPLSLAPGDHTVRFEASWPGKDRHDVDTFAGTVTGCPAPATPGAPGPGQPGGPPAGGTPAPGTVPASGTAPASSVGGVAGVSAESCPGCACECTSRRIVRFTVRRTYAGAVLRRVRAFEHGFKVTVKRIQKRGQTRFRVALDARGHHFTRGGVLRTITVRARLGNGHRVEMVYFWRPCLAADGNPNAPSAAGNHGEGP